MGRCGGVTKHQPHLSGRGRVGEERILFRPPQCSSDSIACRTLLTEDIKQQPWIDAMDSAPCAVCNNFGKRMLRTYVLRPQSRFAFDFTAEEIIKTSSNSKCPYCCIVLQGIQQFEQHIGPFESSVARVYARGPFETKPHTLSLEIYFKDSRPKLEIEYLTRDMRGM